MSSTREIAERTVLDVFNADPSWTNAELIDAVDKALRDERDRCERVAEYRYEHVPPRLIPGAVIGYRLAAREIVTGIREGEHK